jgi:hypothetical protein
VHDGRETTVLVKLVEWMRDAGSRTRNVFRAGEAMNSFRRMK